VANLRFRHHAHPTASPNNAFNVYMPLKVRLCKERQSGGVVCAPLANLAPFWLENDTCTTLLESCCIPGFKLQLYDGLLLQSRTWGLRNPCMLSSQTKPEGCGQA